MWCGYRPRATGTDVAHWWDAFDLLFGYDVALPEWVNVVALLYIIGMKTLLALIFRPDDKLGRALANWTWATVFVWVCALLFSYHPSWRDGILRILLLIGVIVTGTNLTLSVYKRVGGWRAIWNWCVSRNARTIRFIVDTR